MALLPVSTLLHVTHTFGYQAFVAAVILVHFAGNFGFPRWDAWVGLHLVDQYVWSIGHDKTHIAKVFTISPSRKHTPCISMYVNSNCIWDLCLDFKDWCAENVCFSATFSMQLSTHKALIQMANLQELSYVEFFAGQANVWRAVSDSGVPSARVDLTYGTGSQNFKQDPMDILSNAGWAIFSCILFLLPYAWKYYTCSMVPRVKVVIQWNI